MADNACAYAYAIFWQFVSMAGKGRPGVARRDITGKVYGSWRVIGEAPEERDERGWLKEARWILLCDPSIGGCGKTKNGFATNLNSGKTNSCGCTSTGPQPKRCKYEFLDGGSTSDCREYRIWQGMKNRCFNKKTAKYYMYGGRGITVCERWLSFEFFYADMGKSPSDKHQIDRIDNNGIYEPGNCRWVTAAYNGMNTRRSVFIEYAGERLCLSEWGRRIGMNPQVISKRIAAGWPIGTALTAPSGVLRVKKDRSVVSTEWLLDVLRKLSDVSGVDVKALIGDQRL